MPWKTLHPGAYSGNFWVANDRASWHQLAWPFCYMAGTSLMVNAPWWTLKCGYEELHTSLSLPYICPKFPYYQNSNLFSWSSWTGGQTIHSCPWFLIYSNLGLLLFLHKLVDHVYLLKLCSLGGFSISIIFNFKTISEWGCWDTVLHVWLVFISWT